LIFGTPFYSMNPSFLNLFMKKFTRVRVVPTISAQHGLRDLRKRECLVGLAIAGEQQQGSRQPFLAGVEELSIKSSSVRRFLVTM
jgi:hypothetical protein